MGSVGDCFDNAMAESFFATLECELLDRHSFKTQVEARTAVFDFIEGWYNPHRRHSALDSVDLALPSLATLLEKRWFWSSQQPWSIGTGKASANTGVGAQDRGVSDGRV
jgi:hypothetical protein